ncbi:MAG: hypothetical protein JW757_10480 [Anaerolineales bacterium]|nr:hypothetical protein [Anaerolineales bacterium]
MSAKSQDSIERIARFLEREDTRLPDRVTNHMILIAIREERDARQRQISRLVEKVESLAALLEGPSGSRGEGLAARVARLDRFRKAVVWVLSAISLAFLGSIGSWLLGLLVN